MENIVISEFVSAMDIETLSYAVHNGFEKNDQTIICAFVDTYNKFFDDCVIYSIAGHGKYGLEGFVNEGGVDIADLVDIYNDYYLVSFWKRYFFYNGDGFPTCLHESLDGHIEKIFKNLNALADFIEKANLECIMTTANAHSPKLVKKINKRWLCGDKELWKNILYALALRDRIELLDKDILVQNPDDAYNNAWTILNYVCDDKDLEIVINYIRL